MTIYNDELSQYITDLFVPQDETLQRVFKETPEKGLPAISIKAEEGRFLQVLARATSARKALEIGTLGGYSGIWIARGMAPGGKLITVEREPKHAAVAQAHFEAAGLGEQIEIYIGDAHALLGQLVDEGPFDFVFIDAEKTGYIAYFDWALENTRIGGVIVAHNAFAGGQLLETENPERPEHLEAVRSFNRRVAEEGRVLSTIYPAGDGTLVAVRVV